VNIGGKPTRTIWPTADGQAVEIIDQTRLPHEFAVARLDSLTDAEAAIRHMQVRGAPLIGVTAAYGVALAVAADPSDDSLREACRRLLATRPTAVNLRWALEDMAALLAPLPPSERAGTAFARAGSMAEEDVAINAAIGRHGLDLLQKLWVQRREAGASRLNILTHCNAGWLATVDWGTALAPVYKADEAGIPLHVWVDETRPRNQGASLTARELS
jgi:methylthioribose-1-phosphate isomerase